MCQQNRVASSVFFGMVRAAQKGKPVKSKKVADAARKMSPDDVTDFAETKHEGLPERKEKQEKVAMLLQAAARLGI